MIRDNRENYIYIAGQGKGGSSSRTPKEAGEGIQTGIKPHTGLALSKTQIKILDLLSEGPISSLSTGEYEYSGILGNVGWSIVNFKPNTSAKGTDIKWLQSIYWNETPVASKDGNYNFQQVSINYAKGEPNGSNISDNILDELSVTRNVSERLRGGGDEFAKTYRITDKNCIGTIINVRVNQLFESSTKQKTLGDILVSTIDYAIYYRPIFSNKSSGSYILGTNETITGKITAGYIRSSRIVFTNNYSNDNNFLGWEIKVVRSTEDSTTSSIRNQSFIDSLTEIYGSKFIYPNSALVLSTFDAEYFSSIPSRTYNAQLLKIKVPSNYNPIYKTYDESSPWEGDFKIDQNGNILKEWSDNPAWCYYDLITNKRYGLGSYIDENYIDKFTLYEIGKYCDTLVSDGYGGLEPRFSCNVYLSSQEEAYKVVNAMASIFHGITYYAAGQIYTTYDSKKSPIYQFTNANIVNGEFNYSSSAKKARHTVAEVRYNDKRNLYKPTIEYVENIDAIRKYGIRKLELASLGSVSRGQAIRHGRWALLTENIETESINFKAGIEIAGILRPGDIFQIHDNNRKNYRLGGRISNIICTNTSTTIGLDSSVTGLNSSTQYKLSLLTPSFYYDPSLVSDIDSSDTNNIKRSQLQYLVFNSSDTYNISGKTYLSVSSTLDYTGYSVSGNNIWMIEATGNTVLGQIKSDEWETYRVLNIKEIENHIFEINGLQYEVDKFNQIESGFSFTDVPIDSSISFSSPTDLSLTSENISAHAKKINYNFNINDTTNILNYRVLVKTSPFSAGDQNSGEYIIDTLLPTIKNGEYLPSDNSTYYFRVYSIGTNNIISDNYAENSISINGINPIQDITISSLQLSNENSIYNSPGTRYSEIYSTRNPNFSWQIGINNQTNIPSHFGHRITFRKPSNNNIPSSEIYFSKTGYSSLTSNYTFSFDDNYNAVSNLGKHGPFREYDVVVEAMTTGGYSSAGNNFILNGDSDYSNSEGYDILYVNNPKPQAVSLWTGTTSTILPGTTSSFYSTGYATQQSITNEGEIKIFFTISGNSVPLSGFFNDDIAGGTIFYSDLPFTREEAQGRAIVNPSYKVIKSGQIFSADNPVIFPAGLYNAKNQYIALGPFDDFDVAINSQIYNYLYTGINISDAIAIQRNNFTQSFNYKAWVQLDIGFIDQRQWGLVNNWVSTSYNIKDIGTKLDSSNRLISEIVFDQPMNTDYYAIHTSVTQISEKMDFIFPYNVEGYYDVPTIVNQNKNRIVLTPFSKSFGYLRNSRDVTGRYFIGILESN